MEIFKLGQIKTLMMFFILIFSFTPMSEKAFAEQTMNIDRDKSTVLITGSNRGIGLALAQNYAEQLWLNYQLIFAAASILHKMLNTFFLMTNIIQK